MFTASTSPSVYTILFSFKFIDFNCRLLVSSGGSVSLCDDTGEWYLDSLDLSYLAAVPCFTTSTCILRCEAIIFPSTLINNFTVVLFGLAIMPLYPFYEDLKTHKLYHHYHLIHRSYFLIE